MGDNDRETKRYSLKEREYRGEDGKIHHHTNVWMEQHHGDSAGDGESGSRGTSSQRASASRGASAERSASGGRSTAEKQEGARASSPSGKPSSSRGGSGSRSESGARGGTGREEETGREGGGMGRALAAAGVVAMATAAFMVGRRLRTELDSGNRAQRDRPDDRPDLRVVRDDDDRTGDGMY